MANAAIQDRRKRDGFHWTDDEVRQAVDSLKQGISFEEIGVLLQRSKDAVAARLNHSGWTDPGGSKSRWTQAQVDTLTSMWYAKKDLASIAAAIGKDENAVKNKASKLGLPGRFTPEFQKGRKGAMLRDCITCKRAFHSEHIGNRMCRYCKLIYT